MLSPSASLPPGPTPTPAPARPPCDSARFLPSENRLAHAVHGRLRHHARALRSRIQNIQHVLRLLLVILAPLRAPARST